MDNNLVGEHCAFSGNENNEELLMEINSLECPFTWLPERSPYSHVSVDYIIEISTPKIEEDSFQKYCKYMCLIYELGPKENEAFTKMEEWKKIFSEIKTDVFFENNHFALKYVLHSSEAHLLCKKKEYSTARKVVDQLKEIPVEPDIFKATISGLKANFFDNYGIKGHKQALPYARRAMELCEDEKEWIYTVAKNMRDIRRSELYNTDSREACESITEELQLFEKLVKMANKPIYFIRLGNTLLDLGTFLKQRRKNSALHSFNNTTVEECYNSGVKYFQRAIEAEDPPKRQTYQLLLEGINKFPNEPNYKDFAGDCVEKLFFDNEFDSEKEKGGVYLAVGKYYQKFEKDEERAEYFFRESANLGSLNGKKEVIMLDYKADPEKYDPCEDIIERMNIYPDKPKKIESLCQIVSYHLIIKEDLLKAVESMKDVMKEDPNLSSIYIKKHKSWFQYMKHTNLLKLLINEICLRLNNQEQQNNHDDLTDFLESVSKITVKWYNEVKSSPDPKMIKKIKSKLPDRSSSEKNFGSNWREKSETPSQGGKYGQFKNYSRRNLDSCSNRGIDPSNRSEACSQYSSCSETDHKLKNKSSWTSGRNEPSYQRGNNNRNGNYNGTLKSETSSSLNWRKKD